MPAGPTRTFVASELTTIGASLVLAGCGTVSDSNPWADRAVMDINAAYEHTVASHPGYVDPEEPAFARTAAAARTAALNMSEQVADAAGYAAVLAAYSATFRDGHYGIAVRFERPEFEARTREWPGLFLAWRNDRAIVIHSEDDPELREAVLIQCDDIPVRDLVLSNVFAFDNGKPEQPSYWARRAMRLLVDHGNPFVKRPERCEFRDRNGNQRRVKLSWRAFALDDYRTLVRAARFGDTPSPGVRAFGEGRYWVNLPDFSPSGQTRVLMNETISRLESMRPELRAAEAIVFDMRGNQGGNSLWGVRAIEAVWGRDYRLSRQSTAPVYVDWRISDGNVAHAAAIVETLERNGETDALEYFAPIADGLASASAGQLYFRVLSNPVPDEPVEAGNPVRANVLLLTHGDCASSCLDFVDEMMALQNVVQVGYPTGSDTNYLEVRRVDLPSGLSFLVLPTKVYRGRPRASGEFYAPRFQYDALDWSDRALESWVTDQVLPRLPDTCRSTSSTGRCSDP